MSELPALREDRERETQRRRALLAMLEDLQGQQAALVDARRHWIETVDAISDPMMVHDEQFRVVRANRAYAERAGVGFGELIGRPYWTCFPRRAGPLPGCARFVASGAPSGPEEFTLDGGQSFVSRSYRVRNGAGEASHWLHVFQDVTERRRLQSALERSERHFRKLIEGSSDAFFVLDRSGVIVYRSPSGKALTGYDDADVMGKPITTFALPEYLPAFRSSIAQVLQAPGAVARAEARVVHKLGHIIDVEAVGKNLLADPDVGGIAVTVRDITERKRSEAAERARLERRLAQAAAVEVISASENLARGDVEALAREITEAAARVAGIERANAWLFNEAETELRCIDLFEATPARHSVGIVLKESEFREEFEALKKAAYVAADDPLADPRTAGYGESYLQPLGITSMLDAVVQVGGRHLGLLCFEHVGKPHRWEEDEIAFACQLADKIVVAISNRERRRAEATLQEDAQVLTALNAVAETFTHGGGLQAVLERALDAAIEFARADMGNIQLLNRESGRLEIRAQRGFAPPWLSFWQEVAEGKGACGTAMLRGERVIIEDVAHSPVFAGTPALEVQLAAGVLAVVSTPLVDSGGQAIGMYSVHFKRTHRPEDRTLKQLGVLARLTADIVSRAAAAEALERTNRALRTLSKANETLVRARDEAQLMDEMVRVLVETGGYPMAWVGYAEQDATRTVRPVARAGDYEGYLDEAHITWGEDARGLGPTGMALKTGRAQVNRDFASPALAPWRERARKKGFTCSVALPLGGEGGILGALTLYSRDPRAFDAGELKLLEELAGDLAYGIANLRGALERRKARDKLRASLEATVGAMAFTVEMRDPYTAGHQRRVAQLAAAIAEQMGLTRDRVEGIHFGALIHDLGKIQVPAELLAKPTRLTKAEFELIKAHPQAGYDALKGIDFPWPVAEMVHQHHERLDGSGYPQGLKGDAIALEARILAVADVVEAMASHRPYRPGLGIDAAMKEIESKKGASFDAAAVEACVALFRDGRFRFDGT